MPRSLLPAASTTRPSKPHRRNGTRAGVRSLRLPFAVLLLGGLLAACASGGDTRGWHGADAQPFDASLAECENEAASQPAGDAGAEAMEACMARHGWTRSASGR